MNAHEEQQSRATQLVQRLVEQESFLMGLTADAKVNVNFSLDFEELFDVPGAVEDMRPNGDAKNDLAQLTDFVRTQTTHSSTPMEEFLTISRISEPQALYSSFRMAEMGLTEGVSAHIGIRASLLQLAGASFAACVGGQRTSGGSCVPSKRLSRAQTEPARAEKRLQGEHANGALLGRARSI